MATRVLVIDNYDSFVYNLVQYLGELRAEPIVLRNDELGHGPLVVSEHQGLGSELSQVLHEVVDEAVVVVDHQHAGRHGGGRYRWGA